MRDSWIGRKSWHKQMRYFRCLQPLIVTVLIGFDLPRSVKKNKRFVNYKASSWQALAGQVPVVQRCCIDTSLMTDGVESCATGWRSSVHASRRIEPADLRKIWSESCAMTDSRRDFRHKTVDFGKSTYRYAIICTGVRDYWFEYAGY